MTAPIIDGMAGRVSSPVLIGRSNELERLHEALRLARDGRSSATLIAGEAGVGKTRLVTELAELASREGCAVLAGGCIDLGEGAMPYAPVVEALRGLIRRADPDELEAFPRPGPLRAGAADARPGSGDRGDRIGSQRRLGPGTAVRAAARRPR